MLYIHDMSITLTDREADACPVENKSTAAKQPVDLAPPKPAKKQTVSLRLDGDIVAWFRANSPHYQVAMRQVLRAYIDEQGQK